MSGSNDVLTPGVKKFNKRQISVGRGWTVQKEKKKIKYQRTNLICGMAEIRLKYKAIFIMYPLLLTAVSALKFYLKYFTGEYL